MIAALGGSAYALATAPLVPWWAIAALAGAAALVLALGVWRARARHRLAAGSGGDAAGDPRQPVAGRGAARRRCATSRSSSSTSRRAKRSATAAQGHRGGADSADRAARAMSPISICASSMPASCSPAGDDGTKLFAALNRTTVRHPAAAARRDHHDHRRTGPRRSCRLAGGGRPGARRAVARAALRTPGRARSAPRRQPGAELRPGRQGGAADHPRRGSARAEGRAAGGPSIRRA